ncbi:MAG: helix-turn-helix transcriptional regulator, partial [Deltaproteobacteria bacterium]|nr:helix-turn-helix transcriptional regulator [Deltaproteobacteria bacterium]
MDISTNIKKPALVTKRREQILQAALDLFRKKGYHGTSIRQICEKSKVNRASIY